MRSSRSGLAPRDDGKLRIRDNRTGLWKSIVVLVDRCCRRRVTYMFESRHYGAASPASGNPFDRRRTGGRSIDPFLADFPYLKPEDIRGKGLARNQFSCEKLL